MYKVNQIRKVKTKFGYRIVLESIYFQCFLSACYSQITDVTITNINGMNDLYFNTQIGHNKFIQISLNIQIE